MAILKESHYYPFGLQHQGYVSTHNIFDPVAPIGKIDLVPVRNYLDDSYRYTFGGKEEQPELGLNWMDHHARNYDAALGRWMNVDPLGELAPSWTPYRYGFNNPMRFVDPTGLFETRAEARSYRKENNIKGKIQKGSDGNFAINDRKNNRSYYKDSSLDDIENVIGRGEDGVIESVFLTSSSSTSSSSGGFYVQDGTPIWGFGTEDNGHKNGTRRGSVDMRKMPFSGPTGPKSSSKFAEWIRYMLTGLGLVDNMPVVNKTAGVIPKVSYTELSVKKLNIDDTIPVTTKHWITNKNGKPGAFVTIKHKNIEHANRSIKHYMQKGTTVNDIIIDSITKEIHK